MKLLGRIWFPAAVLAAASAGVVNSGYEASWSAAEYRAAAEAADTVIYTPDAYKIGRKGDFGSFEIADSLLGGPWEEEEEELLDTLPHLTARDTIKVPDSLRYTDPFRYKYYVALIDSLTHVIVRDSLRHSSDSLRGSYDTLWTRFLQSHAASDSITAFSDSLHARLDSLDWRKIDSIYVADSAAVARATFLAWYNSLSRKERRKYDQEQLIPIKMAQMDSLRRLKEDRQAYKDSLTEVTPRILETYALPDSMLYKRIVRWRVDPDFQNMEVEVPDTTFNYHFYDDRPWQRKDVNASWLGVEGSPVQYYNYFNRGDGEGVDFYSALEPWSASTSTMWNYNVKMPHTELAYYGTLLAGDAKEGDNLHIFTTQNITPELNFHLLYDRFGGGGLLENQETKNKTMSVGVNYLGKKYMARAGYLRNIVSMGENGGVQDNMWIRDTTVEVREIDVALKDASSKTVKNSFYLEQQLRIPFNFINRIKARKDTTFHFDADSLDRDITTAFIGHSSELSTYSRTYSDNISSGSFASGFYNDVFNFGNASADSLGMTKLDNKLFIRLQPWSAEAVVSKLDVGVGDVMKHYFDSTSLRPTVHKENSLYLYAGAEGQLRDYIHWNAKGRFTFAGDEIGDFGLEANARLDLYPFRRARKSPLSLSAHFETTLKEPNYYQKRVQLNHFSWDNDFSKISTTKIQGRLSVPHWGLDVGLGYALLGNNIYYDTLGVVRQNAEAMSVLSADVRKDFVFGPWHMENKALFQVSSNPEVIPLPAVALNLKWYFQFVLQKDETKTSNILVMQVGANAWYNTQWYSPAWNPNLGVFHNQNKNLYENGPFFDVFLNFQWKKAVIFIKYQNAGAGWPMRKFDYFSADHYIVGQNGTPGLKLGIYWPFYTEPGKHSTLSKH